MIQLHAVKVSRQAAAIVEESADVRADLQARLASQTLHVPLSGADLLTIQQAIVGGLGGCQCEQCIRVRTIIAGSLHRLQMDALDRDRVRRVIDPADRWHPRVTAAGASLDLRSPDRGDSASQGGRSQP